MTAEFYDNTLKHYQIIALYFPGNTDLGNINFLTNKATLARKMKLKSIQNCRLNKKN